MLKLPPWAPMSLAPRTGAEVLLLLGETIPDHMNVRAGSFVSGDEAEELGYREYAKYGAWIIWHDAGNFYCIDVAEPFGWLPLPALHPAEKEG